MYAIVECGGKQFKVTPGQVITVEKLPQEVGEAVQLDRVLLIGGEKTVVGSPVVAGAMVNAKVIEQGKSQKIIVFHYKAKKNIRKKRGHRQPFTRLLVEAIEG